MSAARRAWVIVALSAAACGHVGYDPIDGDPDAEIDAPLSHLIHQYRLEGDYSDDLGGPALIDRGGSLVAGGYRFEANQGLSVLDALPDQVYSVDLVFWFDAVDGWRKILDYKNLQSDNGFYVYDTALQFVVVAGSVFATGPTSVFSPTAVHQVTITRDATGRVDGYVDLIRQFQFTDTDNVASLDTPGAVVHFFVDDLATSMSESSGGVVRRIRIYDVALAETEIPP